jgi:hypothetical protein
MKRLIISSLLFPAGLVFIALSAVNGSGVQSSLDVSGLESARAGRFPSVWRTWPFQRGKAIQVYSVQQEGDLKFIRAKDSSDISVQILRNFNWNIKNYPYLSWKWRAGQLPVGAQENNDDKNDSACGVYVTIGTGPGARAMKYVWSTGLAVGDVVTRRDGKLKIKVADSGSAKLNQWRNHTVNVPQDYKALFGEDLGRNPSGIALLTDGNATHTAAACDYAQFTISSQPPQ